MIFIKFIMKIFHPTNIDLPHCGPCAGLGNVRARNISRWIGPDPGSQGGAARQEGRVTCTAPRAGVGHGPGAGGNTGGANNAAGVPRVGWEEVT